MLLDSQMKIEEALLDPVDIGQWLSYAPYSDPEQIRLQKENLIELPIHTDLGSVKFIFTKNINTIHDYTQFINGDILIEDTSTILEEEVYYTSKIEGAKTTKIRTQELHNGANIDSNNAYSEYMVKNSFDAVKLLNLYGNKVSEEILLKVWKVLTENCRDNTDIQGEKYRNGDVTVGSFTGSNVENIEGYIKEWISFYNSQLLNSKPFLKAAILHYTFETIHPFCDGNGRLGRLLMNNYLIQNGIDSAKAVSFSMEIDKRRSAYDAAFVDSENEQNDCTKFIDYMLDVYAESYTKALELQKVVELNE